MTDQATTLYLGDNLYARRDGHDVVVEEIRAYAERPETTNKIILTGQNLAALNRFVEQLPGRKEER